MPTTTTNLADSAVQKAVSDELAWSPDVDATRIGVSVNDGAVTLSGEVATFAEKLAAVDAALRVHGVTALADELTVQHLGSGQLSDTDIAAAVHHALSWADYVPADTVKAEVRDHIVILTGTVDWNYQRTAARQAVERLAGVHDIDNRIELTRRPSSTDAATRIKQALVRNALLDANSITVEVDGTEVMLEGVVQSWVEREQAEHSAWASPHVSVVRNFITVEPR